MKDINDVCRFLGKKWTLVLAATVVLLILIISITVYFVNYDYIENTLSWISLTNGAIELAAEIIAFFIAAMLATRMGGSQFGPGIGLLALSLFYWMLSDVFWFAGLLYHKSTSLLVGEEFSGIMQSIFTILAAISLRDILEAAKRLEIKIDHERAKKEVSKIVESEYFEKIKKDAIELRKKREAN